MQIVHSLISFKDIMVILIDIGGTNTRVACSKDMKTILRKISFLTCEDFSLEIAEIKNHIGKIADGVLPERIIVAIPGPITKEGRIFSSVNLKKWEGINIKEAFLKTIAVPTSIANDAELGALGEAVSGAGKDHEVAAFLTVSTGIGGARIISKAFDVTSDAFEPGKQIIDHLEGKNLEQLASGSAVRSERNVPPREITDKAYWKNKAKILAVGVWNCIVLWSPEIFILGGPMVLRKPGIAIEEVRAELNNINNGRIVLPPIVLSALADEAGLYGAMAYARMLQKGGQ